MNTINGIDFALAVIALVGWYRASCLKASNRILRGIIKRIVPGIEPTDDQMDNLLIDLQMQDDGPVGQAYRALYGKEAK